MPSRHRCCVPLCNTTLKDGISMHTFPMPREGRFNEIERFRIWVMKIGGDFVGEDNLYIYKNRRVCHRHFEAKYIYPNNRLTRFALPTLHIPGVHVGPHSSAPMILEASGIAEQQQLGQIVEVDQPSQSTSTAGQNPPAVTRSQITINSKMSLDTATRARRARRAMSKIERELRDTLAETKVALRKCRTSKTKLKTKLYLANKIMKTSAIDLLSKKMTPTAKSFFNMQISQFGKKARGRRFTLDEKILALSLYKPCPKAYRLLSKICILPKRSTLDKVLRKVTLRPGINEILFENLKKTVERLPKHQRICSIIFDEMSIAPHVAFDKNSDHITGFVDNGEERQKKFCDHVLVFMVRGVIKKFKQPVAFSFCTGSTKTTDLKKQIELVTTRVIKSGLQVVATVCDQGASNMAAMNVLMRQTRERYVREKKVYKGGFFEVDNKKIYVLYDPPHIMKGIRNNLLTKDLEYMMGGKLRRATWAHLEALYRRGPGYKGVRLINKLTAQHVFPNLIPKMRVKYCTQVFSQNVGATMGYMAGIGKLPKESVDTADLLMFFDNLFDSVNGSFSKPVNGKIYRCAVTPRSPHHKLWHKSLPILKSMKFVTKNGTKKIVPSISSWVKTIEAFLELTKYLHTLGVNSLLLRHFNQDPLENFFGSIRAHGIRNVMPSASAFVGAYKALLLNNLSSPHSVGSNCEEDENRHLQSLKFFLKNDIIVTADRSISKMTLLEEHLDIDLINTNDLIRSQTFGDREKCAAIAYCSGWLVRLLKTKIYKKCITCNLAMESEGMQPFHEYIKVREYQNDKTWLTYPTRRVFDYFCHLENIVTEVMKTSCHIRRISEYIELIASVHLNTNFITCDEHRERITRFVSKKCVVFFINNWCKEINQIINGKTTFFDEQDEIKQAAHAYYCLHKRRKVK